MHVYMINTCLTNEYHALINMSMDRDLHVLTCLVLSMLKLIFSLDKYIFTCLNISIVDEIPSMLLSI